MGYRRQQGAPNWFVMLVGIAFVFGVYYLWTGFQNYMEAGGRSTADATRQAISDMTATQDRREELESSLPTSRPTSTPRPTCQDFVVIVESAIMRDAPSTSAGFVDNIPEGTVICVIQLEAGTDWYLVDREPITRRVEVGYMRQDLIEAVAPTPTPSETPLPPPTITATFTDTPTITPTFDPNATPAPSTTPLPSITPAPSITPTHTPMAVNI
jgi:hypothetical protein